MGAYPSVSSVSSSNISQDVDYLKEIFPDKFSIEQVDDSGSVTLFANDGKLTVVLVDNPATNTLAATTATLVVNESDLKQVAKNMEQGGRPRKVKQGSKSFKTKTIQLPGGSVLLLVTPAMVASHKGRQWLTRTLTHYANKHTNGDSNNNSNNAESTGSTEEEGTCDSGPQEDESDSEASASSLSSSPSSKQQQQQQQHNLPEFPSLDFRLLQKDGHFEPNFPLNSREGVPFDTELFKGKILFLLRPPGNPAQEDPYWNDRIWAHKQRRIVVQVQGQFKQTPQGAVYAGAEITENMKLGLVTKGLARGMLKLLHSFYKGVHSSFGDDDERAHIVFPAAMFFERLIATKPGDTPPKLGEQFEESAKSIRERKAGKIDWEWNTEDIYSFDFYSMYLDLPTWSVRNLPFSNDIGLRTFWGKSLLRIILYDRVAPKSETKHKPEYNKYGFVIQAQYLGSSGNEAQQKPKVKESSRNGDESNTENATEDGNGETSSIEEGNILDWAENEERRKNDSLPKSESQVFIVDEDDDGGSFDMNRFFDAEEYRDSQDGKIEGDSPGPLQDQSLEIRTNIDNLCPAWIEMVTHRGNYDRAYAMNITTNDSPRTVFCNADSLLKCLGGSEKNVGSPRMSSAERTRRRIGQVLSENDMGSKFLENIGSMGTEYDEAFLKRKKPSSTAKGPSPVHKADFVARALSDHHWIEEWAVISDRSISFYHPDRKKANHHVGIQHVTKVEKVGGYHAPCFPNHFFLSVETLGRTNYIMFASDAQRDDWFAALSVLANLSPGSVDPMDASFGNTSSAAFEIENPKYEFLHKSSLWDYKHRRVLNCRRFSFRPPAGSSSQKENPLLLVEDALRKALDPRNESDDDILIAFLDSAARLKEADVYELNEESRLVFFLNIYHCMVMHAYLVLGPPGSSFQWVSYFNSISYQCSDDIFSLAELEHCIIRSKMSPPSQFLSRFAIPKSKYRFSLATVDYRINFALNCGSMSNPASVPIFNVTELNQQLEDISQRYLTSAVKVKKRSSREVEVYLPRIMLWFTSDFGTSSQSALRKVMRFLSSDDQEYLTTFLGVDKCKCSVKYLQYKFDCRKLSLIPENTNRTLEA